MTVEKHLEIVGANAVKRLRIKKLLNGHPFMINSGELPHNQCYLEYPDGKIEVVTFSNTISNFEVIRKLTVTESQSIRHRYHLA